MKEMKVSMLNMEKSVLARNKQGRRVSQVEFPFVPHWWLGGEEKERGGGLQVLRAKRT